MSLYGSFLFVMVIDNTEILTPLLRILYSGALHGLRRVELQLQSLF